MYVCYDNVPVYIEYIIYIYIYIYIICMWIDIDIDIYTQYIEYIDTVL